MWKGGMNFYEILELSQINVISSLMFALLSDVTQTALAGNLLRISFHLSLGLKGRFPMSWNAIFSGDCFFRIVIYFLWS